MAEGFSFSSNVAWAQDTTLNETADGYVAVEEDTRYFSILDSTTETSLGSLNATLTNPKTEVTEADYVELAEQPEENSDQVIVFNVEGSDDLYGIQMVQDEDGSWQKYQFQLQRNEEGQLEAVPDTITFIPMEGDAEEEAALPSEEFGELFEQDEEEQVDVKPAFLHLQSIKEESEEEEEFHTGLEDSSQLEAAAEEETTLQEPSEEPLIQNPVTNEDKEHADETNQAENEEFEHVEVNPDLLPEDFQQSNDSDENNEYEVVEGLHITGDIVESVEEKTSPNNVLRQAFKNNSESPKIVKRDNKLYLYVVQHPEKENVDALTSDMSNLCKPKANPRSILKSSFQSKNETSPNLANQEEQNPKRLPRTGKDTVMLNNYLSKVTIPQEPVRKSRLPRKQKIKPVERMDEEIVVQEMMVTNCGFVESSGFNKENQAMVDYVELSDSDEDYHPKRMNQKKKKPRRKRIEITISDSESEDSVIEVTSDDQEEEKEESETPPKRRRGRPPKNADPSPEKKTKLDQVLPQKPEIPCPKCDKTFPSENSLKTHLQHHSLQSSLKRALPEYKYKCDKCEKSFINSILLKKHMCTKLFACTMCKKRFPDQSSLNGHRRIHTKQQMILNTVIVQVSPKQKPVQPSQQFKLPQMHKCKLCSRLCSSVQHLNFHMKAHKFTCATCAQHFTTKLMLEKHVIESCVKSPLQNKRRLNVASSETLEEKVAKGTIRKPKRTESPRRSPRKSKNIVMTMQCDMDDCQLKFGNARDLFRHKVVNHGVHTPDTKVLTEEKKKTRIRAYSGIPASKKMGDVFKGLRLDF